MKILLVGSGGREHALGLRLLRDREVSVVYVYPGNAGMKFDKGLVPLIDSVLSFEDALILAKKEEISLVVIGPEAQLYQAWVDRFKEAGIAAFGPTKAAAFLEESKSQSKLFMKENKIPTAPFETVKSLDQANAVIDQNPSWEGYVLKLSGPALGKGVIVTSSSGEAKAAARDFFSHRPPGIEDGMVIEEKITGREVSLFYICLNEEFKFLTSACDHKRLKDGDLGPNTGGMGAYSPANWVSKPLLQAVEEKFVKPTLQGMKARGTPFQGVLFLGLMIRNDIPYLLEYNVRFGDPETQTILPRLEGDFASLLLATARGDEKQFKETHLTEKNAHALHVVKAARGYPGLFGEEIESGQVIHIQGPLQTDHSQVYFAGVKDKDSNLISSGGRVFGLTVMADSLVEAKKLAYESLKTVYFSGEQFRTDIGGSR